nr:immunoglobulin heavy chain junction region [Mus musculus]MBK4198125.1 immunoglobulin heavy chain junction region [Mus musculus]
CARQGGFAYW